MEHRKDGHWCAVVWEDLAGHPGNIILRETMPDEDAGVVRGWGITLWEER
jgi:hypothetical protein